MKSSSFLYNRPAPGCCSFDYELWVDSDDSHQNYSYVVHANFAGTKCDVEVIKGYHDGVRYRGRGLMLQPGS